MWSIRFLEWKSYFADVGKNADITPVSGLSGISEPELRLSYKYVISRELSPALDDVCLTVLRKHCDYNYGNSAIIRQTHCIHNVIRSALV